MDTTLSFDRRRADGKAPAAAPQRLQTIADDKAMLRLAAEQSRDLHKARPEIYWPDMIASATVGYAGLVGAILLPTGWAILSAVIAVLALYRAELFIHELTHMKHSTMPGFRMGWNLLVGIPLLVPSFMYEGVHNLHHARTRYGTVQDPEYLPLSHMKPGSTVGFILISALAPLGLLIRFGILAPLSLVFPKLRAHVVAAYSGLAVNPKFRRRAPEGDLRRIWHWQEAAASIWAIALLTMVATGVMPLRVFAILLAVSAGVAVINQVRTLAAHLWENEWDEDGEPMSVTAQYLDSVNVPPPSLLPFLWAPVGLRYHALHHLLPSVPYHSLGEAHRRLMAALEPDSAYHGANHAGLSVVARRILGNAARNSRKQ
ncbi:fatty acid desaturase [Stakelama sediminis]|uniref:Fatty acid desaturase n=1 Tax=Stakelama sediminis TaxID=463200 RepID=A0A840Z143_9SPHN|nr:fatty acid desaturase [Stakelama sediminis]MBB5719436.1 fatty acid desaturase [Stakelama sediminis]